MVTFNSKGVKALILLIDELHILLTCYAKTRASLHPKQNAECEKTFPTFYGLSAFMVILGFLFAFRMLYLIFPHLIGFLYFQHKQQEDRQRALDSERKEVSIFEFSHSYNDQLARRY